LSQALARRQEIGFDGPGAGARSVVRGDALLLREMLSNLVDNALRYMPDGGSVTVSLTTQDGKGYTLAVTDTGPGIAPGERERVFEPFYRGADAVAPGTGLGLAIVRTIAAAHNAVVLLSDGPHGVGLRVAVEFPAAPPVPAQRQADVSQSA
jgi:signal transduction histidine kinase